MIHDKEIEKLLRRNPSESRDGAIFRLLEDEYNRDANEAFSFNLSRVIKHPDDTYMARSLAFFAAANHDLSGVRDLSLRWLMEHRIQDLSTALNTVEAVYRTAGELETVPKLAVTTMGSFLARTLESEGPAKFSVLQVLDLFFDIGVMGSVFTQSILASMAPHLLALREIVDDNEMIQLNRIIDLQTSSLPEYIAPYPEEIRRLRLDLREHTAEVLSKYPEVEEYLDAAEHIEIALDTSRNLRRSLWSIRLSKLPSVKTIRQPVSVTITEHEDAGDPLPLMAREIDRGADFGTRILPRAQILHRMLTCVESIVRTILGDDSDRGIIRALPAVAGSYVQSFIISPGAVGQQVRDLLMNLIQATDASTPVDSQSAWLTQQHVTCYLALIESVLEDGLGFESALINGSEEDPFSSAIFVKRRLSSADKGVIVAKLPVGERIDSADVPQADDLQKVITLIDLVGEDLDEAAIQLRLGLSSKRQVNYYKAAARILGLLDEGNGLSTRGRSFEGVSETGRLRAVAVFFEGTIVCGAWMRWAGKTRLDLLDINTVEEFLAESCPTLSEETIRRRSKTLRSWVEALTRFHYAHSGKTLPSPKQLELSSREE